MSSSLTTAAMRGSGTGTSEATLAATERISHGCAGFGLRNDGGGNHFIAFLESVEDFGVGAVRDAQFDRDGVKPGRGGIRPVERVEGPDDRRIAVTAAAEPAGGELDPAFLRQLLDAGDDLGGGRAIAAHKAGVPHERLQLLPALPLGQWLGPGRGGGHTPRAG